MVRFRPTAKTRRPARLQKQTRLEKRLPKMESLERRELLAAEILSDQIPAPHAIFAPGTAASVIQDREHRLHDHAGSGGGDFQPILSGTRWRTGAVGTSPNMGDPMSLTWSIVADGTGIGTDNQTGDSNLVAFMDGIYGGGGTNVISQKPWFGIYERIFDQWSIASGLTFQYEPNDDGAEVANAASVGIAGVRADIRIAGANIDGDGNVLAGLRTLE